MERNAKNKKIITSTLVLMFIFSSEFLGENGAIPEEFYGQTGLLFCMVVICFLILLSKVIPINCENESQKYFLEMRREEKRKILFITLMYLFVFFIVKSIG